MSQITLSAGVRQNLLSLQNTASLLTTTQEHLSTGKKVNSAFDNPSSYFTSQSLNNRANSLNSLLDQIGQATQTLQAANQGLTSLTSLLQQALSTAQQALQAPAPSTLSYGAITTNGTLKQAETIGTITGGSALGTTLGAQADTLSIVTGSNTYNVALAATDTVAAVVNAINNTSGLGASGAVTASTTSGGALVLTANSAATSFTATDSTGETGLTTSTFGAVTGTSALGTTLGAQGDTLSIVAGSNTYNVALAATDTVAAVVNAINNTSGLGATGAVTASTNGSGKLILTSNSSAISFTATDTNGETGLTPSTLGAATAQNVLGTTLGANNDTLSIVGGGGTFSVTLNATDTVAAVVNAINNTAGLGATGAATASTDSGGHLILKSNSTASNVTVTDANGEAGYTGATTGTSTNVPVTGTSTNVVSNGNSTDLFQILQAGGITAGDFSDLRGQRRRHPAGPVRHQHRPSSDAGAVAVRTAGTVRRLERIRLGQLGQHQRLLVERPEQPHHRVFGLGGRHGNPERARPDRRLGQRHRGRQRQQRRAHDTADQLQRAADADRSARR